MCKKIRIIISSCPQGKNRAAEVLTTIIEPDCAIDYKPGDQMIFCQKINVAVNLANKKIAEYES